VVEAVLGAEQVNEELVGAADDRGVGQAVVFAGQLDAVTGARAVFEQQATDDRRIRRRS
jgi:hypothetical protein